MPEQTAGMALNTRTNLQMTRMNTILYEESCATFYTQKFHRIQISHTLTWKFHSKGHKYPQARLCYSHNPEEQVCTKLNDVTFKHVYAVKPWGKSNHHGQSCENRDLYWWGEELNILKTSWNRYITSLSARGQTHDNYNKTKGALKKKKMLRAMWSSTKMNPPVLHSWQGAITITPT